MGRRKQNKSTTDQFDSSDTDSITSTSTGFSDLTLAHETENVNSLDFVIDKCIESLDNKSTRVKALKELLDAFEGHVLLPYLENRYVTLLDHCMNSIKKGKGSPTEACLASRAIGLLAVTVGTGSSAHEIMEQSLPHLERAIVSGNDAVKISVLDCLAIVTFIGANNWDETEKSMKLIWEIIHSKSSLKVSRPSSAVLAAAVSAWSFLLTTIGGCRIDLDSWVEPISFLCTLLENDDRTVRFAAGEAVTIVFETVIGNRLSYEMSDLADLDNEQLKPKWFKPIMSLKAKIKNLVVELSMEAGGKGTADKKNLNNQRDLFQKIHRYFVDEECPETSTKIAKGLGVLITSSWAKFIQLNFMKRFLASGFLKHAQENELLHDVFDITQDKMDNVSAKDKRVNRLSEDKGRTQERNKYRQLAQQMKRGHIFTQED
ncbi:uncharacterized protein M6B38_145785 [Iris pallida]|uniref:Interferon-related developmental regulator 1 n=1 Tax=Iris pallida TaxID=29817 RepID=A0AAX6F9D2_IRIPA|nr:uncharacterized protein M6B38_145785 [Iris pallida]